MTALFTPLHGRSNSVVSGVAGSSKQRFLEHFAQSALDAGGSVIIVDIFGRFERFCEVNRGTYMRLPRAYLPCLNPFSWVNPNLPGEEIFWAERRALVPVLARMVVPEGALTDGEMAWLGHAIKLVCIEHGRQGEPHLVAEYLNACQGSSDPQTSVPCSLAERLQPFTRNGIYGDVFNGQSSIDLSGRLVVLNLEALMDEPALRATVLTALMYRIAVEMPRGHTTGGTLAVIDKPWNWLGSSRDAALLVEECYRRGHAHGASWVFGGYGLGDFLDGTPAAKAAYDHAHWRFYLRQNADEIDQLERSGQLDLTFPEKSALLGLHARPGHETEVLVNSPAGALVATVQLESEFNPATPFVSQQSTVITGVHP